MTDEKNIETIDLTLSSDEDKSDSDSEMELDSEQSDEKGDDWPDSTVESRWSEVFGYWRRVGVPEWDIPFTRILRVVDPIVFGSDEDIAEMSEGALRALQRIRPPEPGVLPERPPAAPHIRRTIRRRQESDDIPMFDLED